MRANLNSKEKKLSLVFNALGDPSRFKIFKLLTQRKNICVSELASALSMTASAVSQHLKILEQANLIWPERNGQMICYKVKKDYAFVKRVLNLIY